MTLELIFRVFEDNRYKKRNILNDKDEIKTVYDGLGETCPL